MAITWDGNIGQIGGTKLRFVTADYAKYRTTEDEVVILKGPWHTQQYKTFVPNLAVKKVLEFGIFEGGSAFLFADMYPDAKYVGIDLRDENPLIQAHLERAGIADRVSFHWRTPQDDRARINAIIAKEFGDQPIDVVIDDCSHYYELTRQSFDITFPRIRTGGIYALEDWDWAHRPNNGMQTRPSPVLSNFVFELISATSARPEHISNARVVRGLALFQKGAVKEPVPVDEIAVCDRDWPKI